MIFINNMHKFFFYIVLYPIWLETLVKGKSKYSSLR